jgi:hypothetical protein
MLWNETREIHNVQLDIRRPRVAVKLTSTKPSTGSRTVFIKAISEERTTYPKEETSRTPQ